MTFREIEFFSNSTGGRGSVDVGLTGGTTFAEVNNSVFDRCSLASDGTTEPAYGLKIYGGNNHQVLNTRFIDNGRALALRSGSDSFVSCVTLRGCEFLENTTYDLGTGGAAGELGLDGGVRNLVCVDNIFGGGEVLPTDVINIVGTSSGIITRNSFALATNELARLVIPAGILYVANYTEAGVTTARPA